MKSPLCWMGGKSRLAKKIVELMPAHEAYAEVFAGGAWVFFRKEESKCESINDMNSDLVVFYRVLQYHIEEFCRQFKFLLCSREWFDDWNRQLAAGGLTNVQRAARFYYLQRQCFSGDIVGRSFGRATHRGPRINLMRLEEDLSAVHLRMSRVVVENLPWQVYIDRYDSPTTFFYIDPPYYGFEDIYGKDLFFAPTLHLWLIASVALSANSSSVSTTSLRSGPPSAASGSARSIPLTARAK